MLVDPHEFSETATARAPTASPNSIRVRMASYPPWVRSTECHAAQARDLPSDWLCMGSSPFDLATVAALCAAVSVQEQSELGGSDVAVRRARKDPAAQRNRRPYLNPGNC